jgi:heat-inducible transcriptional repressor
MPPVLVVSLSLGIILRTNSMPATALDDRRRDVLRTLIQLHVETGEPVGSASLSRALHRALSPASLRSLMADLEALGYLDHPHTSAGRVPTDEGYRFFVDSLMGPPTLPPGEAAAIADALGSSRSSPEQVMERASHILSRLSRHVGFVLAPDIARATFRHIDLVPLAAPRVLVVMVAASGIVTHKVIEVDDRPSAEDLQACANYLNERFTGMTLDAIRARLLELMREEKALYDSLLQKVLALGERAFAVGATEAAVYLDGTSNILSQAEFEDLERMRALFRTFEEKSRLVRVLNACIAGDGIRVLIGHENPDPELRDLSLVTASLGVAGEAGWGLGVMGSTRMEYAHVVALVDQVARAVSDVLRGIRS